MALERVLADTNVCFPVSLLDLVLRLDEASLHQIIWTEDLLRELEDTWVDHGIWSREAARRVGHAIRSAFGVQQVDRPDAAQMSTFSGSLSSTQTRSSRWSLRWRPIADGLP